MTRREKIQAVLDLIRVERKLAFQECVRNAGELAAWETTAKMIEEEQRRDNDCGPGFMSHNRTQANRFKQILEKKQKESEKWAEIEAFVTDEFLNEKENNSN